MSPIIGVCLIIWYSDKDGIITKILSTKLFVGIGLISYSLYLWHYPIFAFNNISSYSDNDILKKLFIVILLLSSSVLSYFFIEKPFRNRNINIRKILKIIFMIVGILVLFNCLVLLKNGKINEFNINSEKKISSPLYKTECKFSTSKADFFSDDIFKKDFLKCKKKYSKFILILGDSHSVDLYNSISKFSKNDEFIVGLNKNACQPSDKTFTDCHYHNALKFIKDFKKDIKFIFFTHKGSYFLKNIGSEKHLRSSEYRKLPLNYIQIENTINYLIKIKKLNSNLLFIGPHIEPNITYNYKFFKNTNDKFNYDLIEADKKLTDKSNYDLIEVDKKLRKISKLNQINYISKIDVLGYKFEKDFIVDGNLTFSDNDHWSEFGELYFGKKLVFNSFIKDILFP